MTDDNPFAKYRRQGGERYPYVQPRALEAAEPDRGEPTGLGDVENPFAALREEHGPASRRQPAAGGAAAHLGQIGPGAATGAAGTMGAMAQGGAALRRAGAEALGVASEVPLEETGLFRWGTEAQQEAQRRWAAPRGLEDSPVRQTAEAMGSYATFIASAVLAPKLGLGNVAAQTALRVGAPVGMAGTAGAGQAAERAIQAGVDEDVQLTAAVRGVFPGVVQVAPLALLLRRIPPNMQGSALHYGRRVLEQAGAEFTVENIGAALQDYIARTLHTPEQEIGEQVPEHGLYAGIGAGILQAATLPFLRGRGLGMGVTQPQDAAAAPGASAAPPLALPRPEDVAARQALPPPHLAVTPEGEAARPQDLAAAQAAQADQARTMGLDEVSRARHGRAPVEVPPDAPVAGALPPPPTHLEVTPAGVAGRPDELQRLRQDEAQRARDLGLTEVARARQGRAPVEIPQTAADLVQANDIVRRDGQPYASRRSAELARRSRRLGDEFVPVELGTGAWALRPRAEVEAAPEAEAAPATPPAARAEAPIEARPAEPTAQPQRAVEPREQRRPGRPAARPEPPVERPTITPSGRQTTVSTPAGRDVEAQFEVMEAGQVRASHDARGNVLPDYPPELQPRDRARQASQEQIQTYARRLDARRLGDAPTTAQGAPLIGPDAAVESGNARTAAIRHAYAQGMAEGYRQWLIDNAEQFGLDAARIQQMEQPMLVRVRTTPLEGRERVEFAHQAGAPEVAGMSAAEQARADAALITDDMLALYDPDAEGNVLAASNQRFLQAFAEQLGPDQRATLITADGRWTAQMATRVRNAVFAMAYGDSRLIELFAEEADPQIRNILNALNRAAPTFARARGLDPTLGPYGFVDHLVDAIYTIIAARNARQALSEYVAQQNMFHQPHPLTIAMGEFLQGNMRSPRKLGAGLSQVGQLIETELQRMQQANLMGDPPATLEQLIEHANQRLRDDYGVEIEAVAATDDLFAPAPTPAEPGPGATPETAAPDRPGRGEPARGERAGSPEPSRPEPEPAAGAPTERVAPTEPEPGSRPQDPARSRVARAARQTDPDPSPAEIAAGNFAMGKVQLHGLPISIQIKRGHARTTRDAETGRSFTRKFKHHYGYIRRTEGHDGDAVDVFIGPKTASQTAWVIDQLDEQGGFDEHKVMLGFETEAEARRGYLAHYPRKWDRLGAITEMPIEQLREWIERGDLKRPVGLEPTALPRRDEIHDPGVRYRIHEARITEPDAPDGTQLDLFQSKARTPPPSAIKRLGRNVRLTQVGTMRVGRTRITTPEDAAHVAAPFRKAGQENFVAIVTDADGNLLRVVRQHIGTQDASPVAMAPTVGSVLDTSGAKRVWVAHNHPSGNATQSQADARISRMLMHQFEGTPVTYEGSIVVAPGIGAASFSHPNVTGDDSVGIRVRPLRRQREQPIVERHYGQFDLRGVPVINSPNSVLTALRNLGVDTTEGLLLLDVRHRPVAFTPEKVANWARLTKSGMKERVVRLLHQTNAGVFLLNVPANKVTAATHNSIKNLIRWSNSTGTRVVDAIVAGESAIEAANDMSRSDLTSEIGQDIIAASQADSGYHLGHDKRPLWFSRLGRQDDGLPGMRAADVREVMQNNDAYDNVQVVQRVTDLPNRVRQNVEQSGAAHMVEGLVDRETGAIYLIADNLADAHRAEQVYLHELVGHLGVEKLMGDQFVPLLDRIYNARTAEARHIADVYGFDLTSQGGRRAAAAELLARFAERNERPSLLARVYAAIRRWLRNHGFVTEFSDADLQALLSDARRAVQPGRALRQDHVIPQKAGTVMYSLRETAAASEAQRNQGRMTWGIAEGQPIDRAFRLPFQAFGMLDAQGRFKAGVKSWNWFTDRLINAKFHDNSPFSWANPLLETARQGMIDRFGLSEEFKKTEMGKQAEERRIQMKGLSILQQLSDAGIGSSEARVLKSVLEGETVPDAAWAQLSEPIRRAIDELGQEAVMAGIVSAESYEHNKGRYLHRAYLGYEAVLDRSGMAGWVTRKLQSRRSRIAAEAAKRRGKDHKLTMERLLRDVPATWWGRKLRGAQADRQLHNTQWRRYERRRPGREGTLDMDHMEPGAELQNPVLEVVYVPADQPTPARLKEWDYDGEYTAIQVEGQHVLLNRDFTKAEREAMGEIMDARYLIGKMFHILAQDIANAKFFNDIAKNPEWVRTKQPDPRTWTTAAQFGRYMNAAGIDWVKVPHEVIPRTKATKYGALSGKWVRSEIWRDLNELDRMQQITTWRTVLTQWKLNKTARSPVVHMNNVMSNLVLMDLADIRVQDLVRGFEAWLKRTPEYEDAVKHGALGTSYINAEIQRNQLEPILQQILKEQQKESSYDSKIGALSRLGYGLWNAAKKGDRFMVDMYQWEDEIFRMATYMRARARGDSAQEAAYLAREQFLNYDIRAPWVNALRMSFLPFISYTYRAVPVIAQSIAHRPWKLAKYAVLAHLAQAFAYELSPGDEEEERKFMSEERQGRTWIGTPRMWRMPWRDPFGNPVFLDTRRWIPAGDIYDTNQGQLGLPAPLQFGGPLMLAGELFLNKQAFTGREIWNDRTDDFWDKTGEVSDWAWKSWMPSAAWIPRSWYWDRIWTAAEGGRDPVGRPYSVPHAALNSFGIKIQPHDVDLSRQYRAREFMQVRRALEWEYRQLQRDRQRNLIGRRAYERETNRTQRKLQQLNEEARKLFGG